MAQQDINLPHEIRAHVYELLLNDESVHAWMTQAAAVDIMNRGLGLCALPKEQYDELICMNQMRYLNVLLASIITGDIGITLVRV